MGLGKFVRVATLSLAFALLAASPASAVTRIGDPDATGQIGNCTQNDPSPANNCSLDAAASVAVSGDDVLALPDEHLPTTTVEIPSGVTLHSAGPTSVVTVGAVISDTIIELQTGAVMRDVDIFTGSVVVPTALVAASGATVERVSVTGNEGLVIACSLQGGGILLRDTVCQTGRNSDGRALEAQPSGASAVVTLRNVTAIGDTANGGTGLRALASGTNTMTMYATNVIAQGDDLGGNKDVNAGGDGTPATVILDHSNYSSATENIGGSVTDPDAGVNGNVHTTDPIFVNAGNLDFHEAAGSTGSIDRGTGDAVNGVGSSALDFDGNPRCMGSVPDIGAYEFSAAPCPVPVTTTPAPTTPAPKKKCKKKRTRSAEAAKKKCKKKRR